MTADTPLSNTQKQTDFWPLLQQFPPTREAGPFAGIAFPVRHANRHSTAPPQAEFFAIGAPELHQPHTWTSWPQGCQRQNASPLPLFFKT